MVAVSLLLCVVQSPDTSNGYGNVVRNRRTKCLGVLHGEEADFVLGQYISSVWRMMLLD
jgi:hypothetical protein